MKILIADVANTMEFYRSDPALSMELSIIDPSDASVIESPVVTDDPIDVAIVAAISRNDTDFIAAGLAKNIKYMVQHTPATAGPSQIIETVGVDTDGADLNTIKYPFMYSMAAGCKVKGIRSSASHTPSAADYSGKMVWAQWTDSNGLMNREAYLVLKYALQCPVTDSDVMERWPRLDSRALPTWQQVAQVGWQPQIDKVWDYMRDYWWNNGKILDRVVSGALLEEAFYAVLEKQLTNMGIDPSKSGDPLRDAQNRAGQKAAQLLVQAFGAINEEDTGDDNKSTGDGFKKSISLSFVRKW